MAISSSQVGRGLRVSVRCLRALVVLGSCLGMAVSTTVQADSMRCGTRLVSEGDGKDKVRTLCGEPTSVSLAGYVGGPGYYTGPYENTYLWPGWTTVPVEIWTYNFGPSKLLRKLRFVGDELDKIWTNGHGY